MSVFTFGLSWAIDFDVSAEKAAQLVDEGRRRGAKELEAAYRLPDFKIGAEESFVVLRTKSYDIMHAAASSIGLTPTERSAIQSRGTFDVELTVKRMPPYRPPSDYKIQVYQAGMILLPAWREEHEEGEKVVIRAGFRELVLKPDVEGTLHFFTGTARAHDPTMVLFGIDFNTLR